MDLKSYFPFKDIRPLQLEAMTLIDKAYDNNKRFVILEAPAGSGKSCLALALARKFSPAHVMTPQKILQKQYIRDFSDDMFIMKGKSNYYCDRYDMSCGNRDCKVPRMSCNGRHISTKIMERVPDDVLRSYGHKCDYPGIDLSDTFKYHNMEYDIEACEYKRHQLASRISMITLHNFHSFINQACFSPNPMHEKRDILIIDEAHNIENICMDAFHLMLSNRLFNGERFPTFIDLSHIIKYFTTDDYKTRIDQVSFPGFVYNPSSFTRLSYLRKFRAYYEYSNRPKLMKEYDILISKIDRFAAYHAKGVEFVSKFHEYRGEQKVELKPVYISFWMDNLFRFGDKIFMTSATILDKEIFCENLGISEQDAEFISLASEFPKEKRKIYALPVADMTYKNIDASLPKMISVVSDIITSDAYKNKKGIIHTHTNKITDFLKRSLKSKRLLFADNFDNRDEMIRFHYESKNTILVAPAMHEGLDLIDDHGWFQIIMKIPYPSMEDIQIKERTKRGEWGWYCWLAALKLVQSYGRCVRHKEDFADTYILDSKFIDFVYKGTTNRFLPKWFVEAVEIREVVCPVLI